uniref:Retrovirus-related Pol polyprotein from transposon TNT 1-94 n=1 Tax=Cajanus cajan TaxID=3821 RepID=A0A151RB87_CAJCA|nr:hypothetical protein KK1_038920 [Cajanus cajan]
MASATTKQFIPQAFSTPISSKLSEDNFLTWRQQAESTIRGYCLKKHILGAIHVPSQYNTEDDKAKGVPSSEYEDFDQQDNLLKSWLLKGMKLQFKVRMVGYEWCHQILSNIETYFASLTKARVKQLKIQLRGIKKSMAINQYLLEINKIVNTLVAIRSPLNTIEHIDAIFDGFPEEYDPFITSIFKRTEEYSIEKIEALLIVQEKRLEKHKRSDSVPLQANLAQGNFHTRKQPNNQGRGFSNNFNNGKGSQRCRGCGRSNRNSGRGNKQQCQVCGKIGHIALHCWHRYDQHYTKPTSIIILMLTT